MSELTPWFHTDVLPARDGVYLTRRFRASSVSECWHAMRWSSEAEAWFSAASTGTLPMDFIGYQNEYQWRGLSSDPSKRKEAK